MAPSCLSILSRKPLGAECARIVQKYPNLNHAQRIKALVQRAQASSQDLFVRIKVLEMNGGQGRNRTDQVKPLNPNCLQQEYT